MSRTLALRASHERVPETHADQELRVARRGKRWGCGARELASEAPLGAVTLISVSAPVASGVFVFLLT